MKYNARKENLASMNVRLGSITAQAKEHIKQQVMEMLLVRMVFSQRARPYIAHETHWNCYRKPYKRMRRKLYVLRIIVDDLPKWT
jgi:hypothetical protein